MQVKNRDLCKTKNAIKKKNEIKNATKSILKKKFVQLTGKLKTFVQDQQTI